MVWQTLCKLCRPFPPRFFGASQSCRPTGWPALLLIKAGDVETNSGLTNTHKQVWICDICHIKIQVRKQILIRCNRIENWVHPRCTGIRLAQYTDTWTCHQPKESRLATNTDFTPPTVPKISAYSWWNCQATHNRLQIEINYYPDSLLLISVGFLPRVSSQRLN